MLARYPGLLSGPNQAAQPVRQPKLHRFCTAGVPRATGEESDVDAMREHFYSLRASIREQLMDGTFLVGETGAALGLSPRSSTGPFSEYDDQEEEEGVPSEHEMAAEAPPATKLRPPIYCKPYRTLRVIVQDNNAQTVQPFQGLEKSKFKSTRVSRVTQKPIC